MLDRLVRLGIWIIAGGSLILALFFGVTAFTTSRADSTLSQRGVTTIGSVVDSNYAPDGTSSITVGFKDTSGSARVGSIDVSSSPPPKGATTTITYDPQDPSTLRLAGADAEMNAGSGTWAGIGVLFAAVAAGALLTQLILRRFPLSRALGWGT